MGVHRLSDKADPRRWSNRRCALGLGACALSFLASYLAFVHTPSGQRLDREVFHTLTTETSEEVQDGSWRLLDVIGHLPVLGGVVLLVLLVALARGRLVLGVLAAAVIPSSIGLSRVFKLVVLDRPPLQPDPLPDTNSFPSGHATAAGSIALALVLVVPRRLRPGLAVLGAAWMVLAGFAVVIAGWHRPSDVLGAVALSGALYCSAALAGSLRQVSVRRQPPGTTPNALPRPRTGPLPEPELPNPAARPGQPA